MCRWSTSVKPNIDVCIKHIKKNKKMPLVTTVIAVMLWLEAIGALAWSLVTLDPDPKFALHRHLFVI